MEAEREGRALWAGDEELEIAVVERDVLSRNHEGARDGAGSRRAVKGETPARDGSIWGIWRGGSMLAPG